MQTVMSERQLLELQDLAFESLAELAHLRDRTTDAYAARRADRASAYLRQLSGSVERLRLASVPDYKRMGPGRRVGQSLARVS